MIELVAAVVILGILSAISIASYSKYVSKAKEETDRHNKKLIVNAAKSYLEINTNMKPKEIGESVKIGLWELKNAKYLKSSVYDSKGNSCMDKSYVYVHKNSQGKYTYEGILKCGDDPEETSNIVAQPVVKDFSFNDSNDLKNAAFSMTLYGSEDNTVEIESYSYTISTIEGGSNKKTNTYNSKTISGAGNTKIKVKKIKVADLIDVTESNKLKINVIVKNVLGGVADYNKTIEFEDTESPDCGTITNQATGENDWKNKSQSRTITVACDDRNGSGCLRDTFSKTWPRGRIETVEDDVITIKDNSSTGNPKDCPVKVNFDGKGPKITLAAKTLNNEDAVKIITEDGRTETINYQNYTYHNNGWLNKTYYPNHVKYVVTVEDDINLGRYTWQTGGSETTSGSLNTTNGRVKNNTFEIYLVDEGVRKGTLTVYDKAGNSTSVVINAKIDRTDPVIGETQIYEWATNDESSRPNRSSVSNLTRYSATNCNELFGATNPSCTGSNSISWGRKKLFTMVSATDNLTSTSNISYAFITKGSTKNETRNGNARSIERDGVSCIQYKACDEAGNCSDNTAKTVKIDKNKPNLACKISESKGIETTTLSDDPGSGINNSSMRYVASMADEVEDIQASWVDNNTDIITKVSNSKKCGNYSLKGYAKVSDNSGLETIVKCSGEVTQPTCCSSTTESNCTYSNCGSCSTTCGSGTQKCTRTCKSVSNYNGTTCPNKVTNNVNRNCTDNSKCCSESNPTKCDWATACRQGVTKLSIDLDNKYDGDFAWAGTARHNIKLDDYGNPILQNGNAISTGANDKIYILKDASGNEITKTATDNSGTMLYIKVYVPEYASYYGSNSNPTYKFVWIPKKCVGTYNKICPYSKCTG